MYGYIYKTTNLINNKIYVGKRKSDKFLKEKYLGSGKIIKQAIIKEGKENFKVELLDTAESFDELNEKEKFWIKELNSRNSDIGYNIHEGGNGGENHEPHIQTPAEREKRSKSLKLAYAENRHSKISVKGKKLRKRTPEENLRNSHRQKGKVWLHNESTHEETTILRGKDISDYLNDGWTYGRLNRNNKSWNADKTKYTDVRIAKMAKNRSNKFKSDGAIGCYGLSGPYNINYKNDDYLIENIINKGFKYIWTLYGKTSARIFYHLGMSVFDRCMKICNLEETSEHKSDVKRNKKGKTEDQIQKELIEKFKL